MSQPSPKGNFLQIMLFAAVIFLGFQMLFPQRGADPRDSTKILDDMRRMNRTLYDLSIARELPKFEAKVDEEVKAKKFTPEQGEKLKIEAAILTANTQYRAGIFWNEYNRLNTAYTSLRTKDRSMQGNPLWTETKFTMEPHRMFDKVEFTGSEMYQDLVAELSRRSKSDLIGGFIPGYQLIDLLVSLTGKAPAFSYWFAALLLAALVRGVVWPLAQKQYMFGRQMAQLSPLVAELRERYTDKKTKQITNPQEFQQKSMELYREYGVNPFSGCWPALVQLPFFLAIYQCMVHYQFEFQKGTFLWINSDLSRSTNGFIAPNLGERDYILIGIYAISMVVTTLLAPVSDPANAKQGKIMGVSMAVIFSVIMFFWPLPSAFVLYWVFTNVFTTLQMLRAYRLPLPPLQKVNAPGGGVFPVGGIPSNGVKTSTRTGTPVKHRAKKKK